MAQLPIIDFSWCRDPEGYRLVDSKPLRKIVRNGRNGSEVPCRALSGEEFRIFVSTATSDEGLLEFVQRFGPLTWAGWDQTHGDIVAPLIDQARWMRDLFTAAAEGHLPPPGEDDGGPVDIGVDSTVRAAVVWDPAAKSPRWCFRPNTLLDALWLQFGQSVTRGMQLRACLHCGTWFETGAGTGRRADAKFCSDEHRVAFNSLKRSKGD
jgi:hypothetical protein